MKSDKEKIIWIMLSSLHITDTKTHISHVGVAVALEVK